MATQPLHIAIILALFGGIGLAIVLYSLKANHFHSFSTVT